MIFGTRFIDIASWKMETVPDFTIGFTQEEVEDILDAQKAEYSKTLASFSESNSQVIKRKIEDINLIIAACQRALRKFDPGTYGTQSKVMTSRVSGTLQK